MAIKTVSMFLRELKKLPPSDGHEYFYRGHSNTKFVSLPSIYRNSYVNNEDQIFKEIIMRSPNDFGNDTTTLEKLVKMQHYGLPTRILDITLNPLVALYFAVNENPDIAGEVKVFRVPKKDIKFFDSDTVTILANLCKRPVDFKVPAFLDKEQFNEEDDIARLLHEIRDDKPYFQPVIERKDFNRVLTVKVKMNNNRIIRQNGAFLLFGVNEKKRKPARIPKDWIEQSFDFTIPSTSKENLKKDLSVLGINPPSLFPELDYQTRFVKELYKVNKFHP